MRRIFSLVLAVGVAACARTGGIRSAVAFFAVLLVAGFADQAAGTAMRDADVHSAPTLGVSGARITLNGDPFFPIISDGYTIPDERWVADNVAMGVNTLFLHDNGCRQAPDFAPRVHEVLQGRLRWLVKSPCPEADSIPETVMWSTKIRRGFQNAPQFGGCNMNARENQTTDLFSVIAKQARLTATVVNLHVASESVPGRDTCLTGKQARTLYWTAVAAGASGLELFAFVPARTTNAENPAVIEVAPDVRVATATFAQRIKTLTTPLFAGRRAAGTGIASSAVRYGSWTHHGVSYVVAVNTRPIASTGRIRVGGNALRAIVLWESRATKVVRGVITDRFAPWDVHIYRVP